MQPDLLGLGGMPVAKHLNVHGLWRAIEGLLCAPQAYPMGATRGIQLKMRFRRGAGGGQEPALSLADIRCGRDDNVQPSPWLDQEVICDHTLCEAAQLGLGGLRRSNRRSRLDPSK